MYLKSIKASSLKTEFSLESLPPTSAAVKHHSYKVYHTVQQSEGNRSSPIYFSWMAHNNQLVPVMTEKTVAPDNLLKMISCACKSGCRKNCGCRKLTISCTSMCTACNGQLCDNTAFDYAEDNDDV